MKSQEYVSSVILMWVEETHGTFAVSNIKVLFVMIEETTFNNWCRGLKNMERR